MLDFIGLAELGPQLVKLYIIPRVKPLVSRMDSMLEKPSTSNADRVAVTQIKSLLIVSSFGLLRKKKEGKRLKFWKR